MPSGSVDASADRWRAMVDRHFRFLAQHGFVSTDLDASSPWETWVQYRSGLAAVRVVRSNEFVRAEVYLIRLVEGDVPPDPIWITSATINWTLLDNVLEARAPEILHEPGNVGGLDEGSLDRQLAFWSGALKAVAPDFLAGDPAAIDEAALVVRERVARHPQEVVAWIPADAPADADEREMRELSRQVPPEVGIVTRRYRKRRDSDP